MVFLFSCLIECDLLINISGLPDIQFLQTLKSKQMLKSTTFLPDIWCPRFGLHEEVVHEKFVVVTPAELG